MGPEVGLPGWKQKTEPSLEQGSEKRNTPIPPPYPRFPSGRKTLFDRDGESSDQPRDLVQLLGIAVLDNPRKPNETFVVAQGRLVARNDRRPGLHGIKLKICHQITFANPSGKTHRRMSRFNVQFQAQTAAE
jgi:hypothetical protein